MFYKKSKIVTYGILSVMHLFYQLHPGQFMTAEEVDYLQVSAKQKEEK